VLELAVTNGSRGARCCKVLASTLSDSELRRICPPPVAPSM
jgi:hypothetical protein